jgi:hypothetical protein
MGIYYHIDRREESLRSAGEILRFAQDDTGAACADIWEAVDEMGSEIKLLHSA